MDELIKYLEGEGYKNIREVPGQGLCGLMGFAFTVAIVCGLDKDGYKYRYRYCYPIKEALEIVIRLKIWDGNGDPGGMWIKRKGEGGDQLNPWYEATHH